MQNYQLPLLFAIAVTVPTYEFTHISQSNKCSSDIVLTVASFHGVVLFCFELILAALLTRLYIIIIP